MAEKVEKLSGSEVNGQLQFGADFVLWTVSVSLGFDLMDSQGQSRHPPGAQGSARTFPMAFRNEHRDVQVTALLVREGW